MAHLGIGTKEVMKQEIEMMLLLNTKVSHPQKVPIK